MGKIIFDYRLNRLLQLKLQKLKITDAQVILNELKHHFESELNKIRTNSEKLDHQLMIRKANKLFTNYQRSTEIVVSYIQNLTQ